MRRIRQIFADLFWVRTQMTLIGRIYADFFVSQSFTVFGTEFQGVFFKQIIFSRRFSQIFFADDRIS